MSRAPVVAVAAVVIGVLAVVSAMLFMRPAGLPSRAVASVPALLSEAAGIPGAGLTLAADGLGAVAFGTDADATLATLTDLLGEPVEDAMQPCQSESDMVRWVRWGNLSVAFPGGRFGGYIIGIYYPPDSPELRVETTDGVALRASSAELEATYGDRLAWVATEDAGFPEPIDGFGIDGFDIDHPTATGIGGYVEGGRADGHVMTFFAGRSCG